MHGVADGHAPESAPERWRGSSDELELAIDALRVAKRRWFRDPADLEDVVQNVCLRLARAGSNGVVVESPGEFFWKVWPTELALWLRARALRHRYSGGSAQDPEVLASAEDSASPTEDQIRAAGARLQEPIRSWFADFLSGSSDAEIAARDGVSEAAIRRRWMRLRLRFAKTKSVEEFLDFPLTKPPSRASMQTEAPDSGSPPQAPSPKPQA